MVAIYLYSGTPGSGKSLRATYKIIQWLRKGKNVIANFPIDMDYFKGKKVGNFTYKPNDELTVDYLVQYAQKHHKRSTKAQTLVVIDECGSIFNCRQWENKDRQKWINFMGLHRHFNYDVVLISQSDRLIDRQIRAFIETEYKHRALKNYKLFGQILSLVFGGLFVSVEYWYGPNLKCGSEFFLLNRRKARIYDTMKMFESGGKVDANSKNKQSVPADQQAAVVQNAETGIENNSLSLSVPISDSGV